MSAENPEPPAPASSAPLTSPSSQLQLLRACDEGDEAAVRRLLLPPEPGEESTPAHTHADVNTAIPYEVAGVPLTDRTALQMSARRGHAAIVSLLLAAKADVDEGTPNHGATPLYLACQEGHTDRLAVAVCPCGC